MKRYRLYLLWTLFFWACPGVLLAQEERCIHVYVALCDNVHQGIAPVPAHLGNGQDPDKNLYWGAAYGLKTWFKKSKYWILQGIEKNPSKHSLERYVFRHVQEPVWLVADAYAGHYIKAATTDFLAALAGEGASLYCGEKRLPPASLLAYVGHNGLMDFSLDVFPHNRDGQSREAIMLACSAKYYFSEALKQAQAYPLVWTTGLMAPEAYTLEAALNSWVKRESREAIRSAAADAYHRYQKCGLNASRRLLVSGF